MRVAGNGRARRSIVLPRSRCSRLPDAAPAERDGLGFNPIL